MRAYDIIICGGFILLLVGLVTGSVPAMMLGPAGFLFGIADLMRNADRSID